MSRFAPSPTGPLHLGHAYSAVLAHDLARAQGGSFRLRIEDIDQGRCRADHVDAIMADLRWLSLTWDGDVTHQSSRSAHYHAALEQLRAMGLVYPCWCTRAEVAATAAAAPHGLQPLYPGTCKGRPPPTDNRAFCWRLDCQAALDRTGPLFWVDSRMGEVVAAPERMGDVVLARKDAATSYHIAVVIDDAWQGVTDVVRGQDLFESTHVHRLLQALLGLPVPRYHHHQLVCDAGGERLAKRRDSESLADLRAADVDPQQLVTGMRKGMFPKGYGLSD